MKFLKNVIIVIIGIMILAIIFGFIDYNRYRNNQKPIFAFPMTYMDGGSVEYVGLGYQIIYFNMIEDSMAIQKDGKIIKDMAPIWYTFDDSYIKAVGDIYANLDSQRKIIYTEIKDSLTEKEIQNVFSGEEWDSYFKIFDLYNNSDKLTEKQKETIMKAVERYYQMNIRTLRKNESAKGQFDVFIYGIDYTKIDD